jgi:c-di-GMP-binding flagellar brake protein YcgR
MQRHALMDEERREHERVDLDRPCKVFDQRSGKYIAGHTVNFSDGGALIELARPMSLNCGDQLFLGVALTRRQTLLPANDMLLCEVVRALATTDQSTAVALRFADPIEEVPALAQAA